jgi:hypothetical protein
LLPLGVGALVGLVVGCGGCRVAMGLIALADDSEDFGSITGSGAFVGEISLGGTLAVPPLIDRFAPRLAGGSPLPG